MPTPRPKMPPPPAALPQDPAAYWSAWDGLSAAERLVYIFEFAPADWFSPDALPTLMCYRHQPIGRWGEIKAVFKIRGGNTYDLEKAVDQGLSIVGASNGVAVPHLATPTPHPLCPPLPRAAQLVSPHVRTICPWLEAYMAYSTQWSPRAAAGFHEAIGLWILSTIAARRISVPMGSAIYPVLFLALVARSTLFAKTTTAKLARDLIMRAGCRGLLASDRATPQALLKSMSAYVPAGDGDLQPEAQEHVCAKLAFAAQRGWYFEEWGGMLQQMRRRDSPMAEFHGLLRVLDDGFDSFSSETISRGLEHVESPYLALLASATPHDLVYFLQPGSPWWHDGFWPRFAMIVPGESEIPSMRRRPAGSAIPPGSLVEPLHTWHMRLGIPTVEITPAVDAKGKLTGGWHGTCTPLPCHTLALTGEAQEAYHVYNENLLQIVINGDVNSDLDASYGRLHDKALRIAMLLASFANQPTITLPVWAYAQSVAERWRGMLHATIDMVGAIAPPSEEERHEARIERCLGAEGPQTSRQLQRQLHIQSSALSRLLAAMVGTDRLATWQEGKLHKYGLLPPEETTLNAEPNATSREDHVPF